MQNENHQCELRDLILDAVSLLKEIVYWSEKFNEVVGDIHRLGYHQAPEITSITGYAQGKTTAGGYRYVTEEAMLRILEQDPDPIHHLHAPEEPQPTNGQRNTSNKKTREEIGSQSGWKCSYCSKAGTPEIGPDSRMWHIDHLFAKSRNGDNQSDNLVLSCATCNLKKNRLLLFDYLEKLKSS